MEMKFFRCRHCGNIVLFVYNSGAPLSCCGELMQELVPQSADWGSEKHVPVVTISGSHVFVQVGATPHPMNNDHSIEWIAIQTKEGIQERVLYPGMKPEANFSISDTDKVECVVAYCNLHGLWIVDKIHGID